MRNSPWRNWNTDPPDQNYSGHIEVEDGQRLCYSELNKSWFIPRGAFKPTILRWRFVGPIVPTIEEQGESIIVWPFDNGPGELQALSTNGGDEDWIALIHPKLLTYGPPAWLDSEPFSSGIGKYFLQDKRLVIIGSHA